MDNITSSYFEANMRHLRERFPELAARAAAVCVGPDILVAEGKRGHPAAVLVDDGTRTSLNSRYDPWKEAERSLDTISFQGNQIALFLGFGLGYQVLSFLRNRPPLNRAVIVVEPRLDLFRAAMECMDLSGLLEARGVFLLVGLSGAGLLHAFHAIFNGSLITQVAGLKVIPNRVLLSADPAAYRNALTMFRDAVFEVFASMGNDPGDTFMGLEHILQNLPLILSEPGLKPMSGLFAGRPAVVVSSGPSLAEQVPRLRRLQDRALIVAAASSYRFLLDNGIRPHLVMVCERPPDVARLFEGLESYRLDGVILNAVPVVHDGVFQRWHGPKLLVYRSCGLFEWIPVDHGTLCIGPSVANMAFKVAEFLGCDPIVLVGQDLAYGYDGRTHFENDSVASECLRALDLSGIAVEGNSSEKVMTNIMWYKMLRYFELDLQGYRGRCINTCLDGARIQGAETMTLKAAAERFMTSPFPFRKRLMEQLQRGRERLPTGDGYTAPALIDELTAGFREKIDFYRVIRSRIGAFWDEAGVSRAGIDGWTAAAERSIRAHAGGMSALVQELLGEMMHVIEDDSPVGTLSAALVFPTHIHGVVGINGLPVQFSDPLCVEAATLRSLEDFTARLAGVLARGIDLALKYTDE